MNKVFHLKKHKFRSLLENGKHLTKSMQPMNYMEKNYIKRLSDSFR